MREVSDRIEMAYARLRICDCLEYESVIAATTCHSVAGTTTDEYVVPRPAYKRVGFCAPNEDEGIMCGEVSIRSQISPVQIMQSRAVDS